MANLLVLVSYKVFPAQMGGQKAVVGLYEHLSTYHRIHLAVSIDNDPAAGKFSAFRILHPHKRMAANVFQLLHLKKLCKTHQVNCLIAEHSYTGWIAYLLKKLTGIPFIIRSHNIEASRFQQMNRRYWKFYRRYEKWIHRKADHNFFITEEDQQTAMESFGISSLNSSVVSYGVEPNRIVRNAKKKFAEEYGITSKEIFYFNGTLDYLPNTLAVRNLEEKVYPLLESTGLDYTIIISGRNLPEDLTASMQHCTRMVYIGYVDEVEILYQSASVFLNPINNNSGIKTKVVEALANHCNVVSMRSGAVGIPIELCGDKMKIAEDDDWEDFSNKVVAMVMNQGSETPNEFFEYFSAENIAKEAARKINSLVHANT